MANANLELINKKINLKRKIQSPMVSMIINLRINDLIGCFWPSKASRLGAKNQLVFYSLFM